MLAFKKLLKLIIKQRWLIIELSKREVKVRYRGTWLGFLWSLLNPLVMMVVYTIVFSFYLRIDVPNYPVFLVCALFPWNWFTEATITGTSCLVDRPGLVRDAIFPSEVLPIVATSTSMMNYIFSLPVLFVVLLAFSIPLSWPFVALPVIISVQFLFTIGLIFFLATSQVFFQDTRYIVQLVLMAAFFMTPILYDLSVIPERFLILLKLNPMTHIIQSYRQIMLYNVWPSWDNLGYVCILSILLIYLGSWVFESHRESFAEYL